MVIDPLPAELEDNGLPWPRKIRIYGDISRELREDLPAFEHAMKMLPDGWLERYEIKRVPGVEWVIEWHEVTQEDFDRWQDFYFGMDLEPPFRIGDWKYKATTWVVKVE